MGWRHLVDDLLSTGALIRPIEASVHTKRGFYLVHPSDSLLSDEARTFCEWIINECKGVHG
ncbi:putative choline sulfate-utilization transcription factor [compost metagenome]